MKKRKSQPASEELIELIRNSEDIVKFPIGTSVSAVHSCLKQLFEESNDVNTHLQFKDDEFKDSNYVTAHFQFNDLELDTARIIMFNKWVTEYKINKITLIDCSIGYDNTLSINYERINIINTKDKSTLFHIGFVNLIKKIKYDYTLIVKGYNFKLESSIKNLINKFGSDLTKKELHLSFIDCSFSENSIKLLLDNLDRFNSFNNLRLSGELFEKEYKVIKILLEYLLYNDETKLLLNFKDETLDKILKNVLDKADITTQKEKLLKDFDEFVDRRTSENPQNPIENEVMEDSKKLAKDETIEDLRKAIDNKSVIINGKNCSFHDLSKTIDEIEQDPTKSVRNLKITFKGQSPYSDASGKVIDDGTMCISKLHLQNTLNLIARGIVDKICFDNANLSIHSPAKSYLSEIINSGTTYKLEELSFRNIKLSTYTEPPYGVIPLFDKLIHLIEIKDSDVTISNYCSFIGQVWSDNLKIFISTNVEINDVKENFFKIMTLLKVSLDQRSTKISFTCTETDFPFELFSKEHIDLFKSIEEHQNIDYHSVKAIDNAEVSLSGESYTTASY